MECPSCQAEVPDGVAVCPQCDAVVDPSLFDLKPGPSKPSKGGRGGARKVIRKGGTGRRPKISPAMKAQTLDDTKARPVDENDWRSKLSPEDYQAPPAKPSASVGDEDTNINRKPRDKNLDEEFFGDAKSFMSGLSTPDKVAFFGGAGMVVSCFFPWAETLADGEVLGLLSQGALTFLLGIVVMTTITVRTRHTFPKLNPLFIWVAQLGAASFSVLWVLVCIKLSWDPTLARALVGNEEIWVSKPGMGAFFGLMMAVVGTLGTALGLKEISLR